MKPIMGIVSAANRIFDTIVKYMAYIAAAMLVLMAASICLDVVLRFTVNYPVKWVFEGTEYSLLFVTFLGATYLLQKDGHVKLDLVLNAFGSKAQAWINTVTAVIMAGVCLVLLWTSAGYTLYLYQNGITIVKYYTIPQFTIIFIIPVGFFFLFIQSLKRACAYYRQTRNTTASLA